MCLLLRFSEDRENRGRGGNLINSIPKWHNQQLTWIDEEAVSPNLILCPGDQQETAITLSLFLSLCTFNWSLSFGYIHCGHKTNNSVIIALVCQRCVRYIRLKSQAHNTYDPNPHVWRECSNNPWGILVVISLHSTYQKLADNGLKLSKWDIHSLRAGTIEHLNLTDLTDFYTPVGSCLVVNNRPPTQRVWICRYVLFLLKGVQN